MDNYERPTAEQLRAELAREMHRESKRESRSIVFFYIIGIIAVIVIAAAILYPVRTVGGNSMAPGINKGDIAVVQKLSNPRHGDIILYEYGNKKIANRVIALPGDTVNIDEDGTVYVNDEPLSEDYITEKSYGNCDVELPCTVPNEKYFVLGDDRPNAEDSRDSKVSFVDIDQLVGKVIYVYHK